MFDDTVVFTRSGLKNGFIFLGKILVSTLLIIISFGNFSIFAASNLFEWFLKGIEINCEPIKIKKLTLKGIFKNYLLIQAILLLWIAGFAALLFSINIQNSLFVLISIITIILIVLLTSNWIVGFLFHQVVSRCAFGENVICVEGSSVSFANSNLGQFVKNLPLIIVTLGFYYPWFVVKKIRFLISSCYIDKKTFVLKNDFTVGVFFVYSLFASFLSILTLGLGTPWIFLSITKRFIEQYISLEKTDETTLARREVINMTKEKVVKKKKKREQLRNDDLLDDLDINNVHISKGDKKLPLIIIISILLVSVVSYLGFRFFVVQKENYKEVVIQEHYDKKLEKEKKANFERFALIFDGKFVECKDSSSMLLVKGTKEEPFGQLTITKDIFKYISEIDTFDYNISDIQFRNDSTVSLNLDASDGSFTTLVLGLDDSGLVTFDYLKNSDNRKKFISCNDTAKYFDEISFMSQLWDSTFKNALPISVKNSLTKPWQKERFLTLDSTYFNVRIGDFYLRDVDGFSIVLFYARYKRRTEDFGESDYESGFFQSVNGEISKINVGESDNYVSSIRQFLSFTDENGEVHRYKIQSDVEDSLNHSRYTRIRKYTAPNKHYAVCIVDSKMWLEYTKGKSIDTIISQDYDGEWSFGKVTWNNNSSEFYVDNSGPTACIWKYSLVDKNLVKIVPEHEAVLPFWYEENSKGALYYVEGRYIKKATSTNSELLLDHMKNLCLGWPESKSALEGHDYFPRGGLRTKISHLLSFGSIGKWEKLSGMKVFIKGPHSSKGINLNDKLEFGHYNPKFVEWALENILIFEDNKNLKKLIEPIYNKYIRDFVNNMYTTVKRLDSVEECFKKDVARYQQAYENGDVKGMRFSKSYYFVKDTCGLKGYEEEWEAIDGNHIDSSIAFWVRRAVDGTYNLFRELVFRVYDAFEDEEEEEYY